MSHPDYSEVTELAGAEVSREQVSRVSNRYYWAAQYCHDKDVLEVACGSGPGLGYLSSIARTLIAGDIDEKILNIARDHYGDRFPLHVIDAMKMNYDDRTFDTIILFEALYYLPDADAFVRDCRRLLRPGGHILISNANKDLFDFNPSPYSYEYHGVAELTELFAMHGFETEFFGATPVSEVSTVQKILRPIKTLAVRFNLMPKTMASKRLLKRLVFGKPALMPAEIDTNTAEVERPAPLIGGRADSGHKVIYCAARLAA